MAETFAFELRLVDSVSASAKKAADALRGVHEQAKKTEHALDFGKELERAEHQLKRLQFDPKGYQKLIHAQSELAEQRKKLGKESFAEAFKEKLGFGRMATAAFFGDLLAEGLIEGIKKPLEMFVDGIKDAFKAGAAQEKLTLSYRLMFGKKEGGEKQEDQERFAKNTRFTGAEIGRLMIPLFSSGMEDKAARQAFSTASDLEARTGRPIEEFVDMLAKINAKGGITEKMLIGLGLNAKDFYTQLGKANKITAEEAKKRASEGKLNPQAIINQLTTSVNSAQGGAAGTGGKALSETMGERFSKLLKLPEEYMEKISDSPEWKKLSDRLGDIFKKLDPQSATGKKIISGLMSSFSKLEKMVEKILDPANVDKLVGFIEKIPDYLSKAVDYAEIFIAAWAASKILDMFSSLSGNVAGFAEGLGNAAVKAGGLAGEVGLVLASWTAIDAIADKYTKSLKREEGRGVETAAGPRYNAGTGASIAAAARSAAKQPSASADAQPGGDTSPNAALPDRSPRNDSKRAGAKNVNVAPVIHVTVQGSHDGNPAETGKIIAQHVRDNVTPHLEMAATQGGG